MSSFKFLSVTNFETTCSFYCRKSDSLSNSTSFSSVFFRFCGRTAVNRRNLLGCCICSVSVKNSICCTVSIFPGSIHCSALVILCDASGSIHTKRWGFCFFFRPVILSPLPLFNWGPLWTLWILFLYSFNPSNQNLYVYIFFPSMPSYSKQSSFVLSSVMVIGSVYVLFVLLFSNTSSQSFCNHLSKRQDARQPPGYFPPSNCL